MPLQFSVSVSCFGSRVLGSVSRFLGSPSQFLGSRSRSHFRSRLAFLFPGYVLIDGVGRLDVSFCVRFLMLPFLRRALSFPVFIPFYLLRLSLSFRSRFPF